MKRITYFIFCVCLLIIACKTTSSVTRSNFADQYRVQLSGPQPRYELYNVTDSLTRLYFAIYSDNLLYSKQGTETDFTAHVLLRYVVHPVGLSRVIIDSGSVVLNDAGMQKGKELMTTLDIDILQKDKFYVEVTFRDLNKNVMVGNLLFLDHTGPDARNNFLVTSSGTKTPLFQSGISSTTHFSIQNTSNSNKLLVHYFRNTAGPALPPFSYQRPTYSTVADSTFTLLAPFDNILFAKEGFYQVTSDNPTGNGCCISVLHDGYPEITSADQLVYPLRYLTTKTEYYSLDTARNKKKGVDDFWLNCSGSQERARELIRQYYNRVAAANRLFQAEREGWKTDRGMIYLVFGPPANVYKTSNTETWTYGNETGVGNLTFIFDRTSANILTSEEFVLERNEAFQVIWLQAVDSWRQGHVFNMQ